MNRSHTPPCTGISVAARWRATGWAAALACATAMPVVASAQDAREAGEPAADASLLAPIVVDGDARQVSAPSRHRADVSRAGTKTDTAIVEVPQGLSVVTREQMDRQDAASATTCAIRRAPTRIRARRRARKRVPARFRRLRGGGDQSADARRPAVAEGVNWAASVVDPWTLERIAMLRGPASVLGGGWAASSTVSKRPTRDAQHLLAADRQPRSRAACI